MRFPLSIFAHRTKPTKPKMMESHGQKCRQKHNQTCGNIFQPCTPISIWPTLITFHQAWCLWRQRSSDQDDHKREEAPQWDMFQEPTELFWIGCLTGLIMIPKSKSNTLTPNINSQTFWPKVIPHVTNGTIFFICSTSAISALVAALTIPAW